jgi:hypothetical protein
MGSRSTQGYSQMHVKRRRLPNFEACSVALFASLALGGAALGARPPTPSPLFTSSSPSRVSRAAPTLLARSGSRTSGAQGKVESAGRLRRFDGPDSNKDGSVSSAEFDESLK